MGVPHYSTAAVIMHVRRAAHAVASTAEARFHVSKEAPYTSCASFSGPADAWGTCLTRGKVRGHVHAVALQQACDRRVFLQHARRRPLPKKKKKKKKFFGFNPLFKKKKKKKKKKS